MVNKSHIKKERNSTKRKTVLEKKGYKKGKLPKGKELHHVISVVEGGKTTTRNTRVIDIKKHKQIHKNRRRRGGSKSKI